MCAGLCLLKQYYLLSTLSVVRIDSQAALAVNSKTSQSEPWRVLLRWQRRQALADILHPQCARPALPLAEDCLHRSGKHRRSADAGRVRFTDKQERVSVPAAGSQHWREQSAWCPGRGSEKAYKRFRQGLPETALQAVQCAIAVGSASRLCQGDLQVKSLG